MADPIQWYPGHMVKTKREIRESLKLVDAVIELLDARIPMSSRNPEIDDITQNKPRLIVLNKADLAEDNKSQEWIAYFKNKGFFSIDVDAISGKNFNRIQPLLKELVKDKFLKYKEKGIVGKPLRVMVLGIPNVGKSTFINKLSKRSSAKTGDKPGVTRSRQWIKISSDFEILDTPGILWPKFDDRITALHLSYVRSIKDEVLNVEEIALELIKELSEIKGEVLTKRYGIDISPDPYLTLKDIGKRRGCVISGGEIDTERASIILLEDFREGKLGRITLELLSK